MRWLLKYFGRQLAFDTVLISVARLSTRYDSANDHNFDDVTLDFLRSFRKQIIAEMKNVL